MQIRAATPNTRPCTGWWSSRYKLLTCRPIGDAGIAAHPVTRHGIRVMKDKLMKYLDIRDFCCTSERPEGRRGGVTTSRGKRKYCRVSPCCSRLWRTDSVCSRRSRASAQPSNSRSCPHTCAGLAHCGILMQVAGSHPMVCLCTTRRGRIGKCHVRSGLSGGHVHAGNCHTQQSNHVYQ
jgi:hypothetical protein